MSDGLPALAILSKRAKRDPSYENLLNWASGLRRSHRFNSAQEVLEQCVGLDAARAEAWNNLAQVFTDLGRFSDATALFSRSLQCNEKRGVTPLMCRQTLLGFAHSMLRMGQFQYAWPIWEAARFEVSWHAFPGMFPWRGEPTARLLVVCEGGFGDGFNFSRWLPYLIERVPSVTMLVWDGLFEYLNHECAGTPVKVLPLSHQFQYDELAGITHATSIMSLPACLGMTSWDNIPAALYWEPRGYIACPPRDWIGFCWTAEENGVQRKNRSLDMPVADRIGRFLSKRAEKVLSLCLPGKNLYAKETAFRAPHGVIQESGLIDGWEQTALTILKCRYVVTVDTAVAHLAGCLRVPTLLLLPVRSSWQWGVPGRFPGVETPPWYGSTFKAFRNTNPVTWDTEEILKVLERY